MEKLTKEHIENQGFKSSEKMPHLFSKLSETITHKESGVSTTIIINTDRKHQSFTIDADISIYIMPNFRDAIKNTEEAEQLFLGKIKKFYLLDLFNYKY